jgi:hypothetical protein
MDDDSSREEVVAVIDRAVAELLERAEIKEPPIDAVMIARRHLGIEVCLDRGQPQRGRAQRAGGDRLIYVRPEPSEERHQWTIAHEIGEHLKPALLRQLAVPPEATPRMAGESLANLFAYHLLVPALWFGEDAADRDYDVLELKKRYRTASHEVIAWRLLDLPEPCVITIIDNDVVKRRRSSGPRITRELAPAERECQGHVNRHGRPHCVRAGGWTVQGWPIHRADWKREILRSVVDEDAAG